jgi:hypothetical protein
MIIFNLKVYQFSFFIQNSKIIYYLFKCLFKAQKLTGEEIKYNITIFEQKKYLTVNFIVHNNNKLFNFSSFKCKIQILIALIDQIGL